MWMLNLRRYSRGSDMDPLSDLYEMLRKEGHDDSSDPYSDPDGPDPNEVQWIAGYSEEGDENDTQEAGSEAEEPEAPVADWVKRIIEKDSNDIDRMDDCAFESDSGKSAPPPSPSKKKLLDKLGEFEELMKNQENLNMTLRKLEDPFAKESEENAKVNYGPQLAKIFNELVNKNVVIQGLTKAVQFNGKEGKIVGLSEETGRFHVSLKEEKLVIKVLPDCFMLTQAEGDFRKHLELLDSGTLGSDREKCLSQC